MEGWIGLIKRQFEKHGNALSGWALRMAQFTDLYILGGLMKDIVDFRVQQQKHVYSTLLIYDEQKTESIDDAILHHLPAKMRHFIELIERIQFVMKIQLIMN